MSSDYNKEYYRKYYQKFKEVYAVRNKEFFRQHPNRRLLACAKASAKRRNIEFTLTLEDIKIPEVCPLLQIPITNDFGHTLSNPSIDRIDNTKGYTKDNIWIISRKANTMKSNASIDELLTFAKGILNLQSRIDLSKNSSI